MINTSQILDELEQTLKQLGEDTFRDKGPWEVMNVGNITRKLLSLPAEEAGNILKEVAEYNKHGRFLSECLIDDIVESLPEEDDAWFEECLHTYE